MDTPVLQVEALVKHYKSAKAVDGISFDVHKGECFGLLGPNGAGKTTTLEMLEGLVKPTSGAIQLFGETANRELRSRTGLLLQTTSLQDYLTVQEHLALFHGLYRDPLPLAQLIDLCALQPILHQDAKKISGGQRQRLLLALTLMNDPELIFLDEPTTGLDPQSRQHFWSLLSDLKHQGKTLLLTTHYMDEAHQLCDRVGIIDQGKLIALNTPNELVSETVPEMCIRLPGPAGDNANSLPAGWHIHGQSLYLPKDDLMKGIEWTQTAHQSFSDIHFHLSSLEDVFIQLTGRQLRD